MNRPWMKFHTRDWLDNKELRRCSPLARSVLADLMCLAAEGVPYGHLADKIGPLTEAYMASRCVINLAKFRSSVEELIAHERLHKSGEVFFVKRMVDDEDLRFRRAAGGVLGGNRQLDPAFNSRGFLYFMRRPSDRAVKVGVTINPKQRLSDLRKSTREALEIIHIFKVEDMAATETEFHARLSAHKVSGEWFTLTDDLIEILRQELGGPANEVNLKSDSVEIEGYPSFTRDSRERAPADSDSDSSSAFEVKKKKDENFFEVLAGENGFLEWRRLCEEIGVSGSEPDWNRAASAWRHLDFEQKNQAMKGVEARRGFPDDPLVNSLPYNIIADKKWQRKVRDPTGKKKSAGEQYLDDREAALIREREARST